MVVSYKQIPNAAKQHSNFSRHTQVDPLLRSEFYSAVLLLQLYPLFPPILWINSRISLVTLQILYSLCSILNMPLPRIRIRILTQHLAISKIFHGTPPRFREQSKKGSPILLYHDLIVLFMAIMLCTRQWRWRGSFRYWRWPGEDHRCLGLWEISVWYCWICRCWRRWVR